LIGVSGTPGLVLIAGAREIHASLTFSRDGNI